MTMNDSVLDHAYRLYHDKEYREIALGGRANYDCCVYYGYDGSYEKWVWENAYAEARLWRAFERGLAEAGPHGLIYVGYVSG